MSNHHEPPPIIPPGEALPPLNPSTSKPTRSKTKASKGQSHKASDTGGRFEVLNTFVDCSISKLSRSELATWMVLYRDTRNGTARTSAQDIGRRIGTSTRRTLDALGKLRQRGLLTRVHKGGLNRGPSIYRVRPLAREPG